MKKEDIFNIKHKLRTPLTIISGYSQILNSGDEISESKKMHYLKLIDMHTKRLCVAVEEVEKELYKFGILFSDIVENDYEKNNDC